MLSAIVDWSIHNRVLTLALAVLLLGLGLRATRHAELDVFPEFAPPQVVIQTEAPGLSPDEVEGLVTLPVETTVNGVSGLETLRSRSVQGLSVVTAIFEDGTDLYLARQQVGERVAEIANQLPQGVGSPRLAPLTPATGRLLTVGFTSKTLSPMELRDRLQWNVRPRLLGVRGVSSVTIFGGEVRRFEVRVDPDKLAARGLNLTDVLDATRQSTGVRGAGFIENDQQRVTVLAQGQATNPQTLGETLVASSVTATPVRLHDVAEVTSASTPKPGDASINGEPGVILVISKQFGVDTPTVTTRVEAELDKLMPELERDGVVYHPALFRQADFIELAVGNITHSLLLGAGLVVAVLIAFLFNLRIAVISLTAIPLSLLGAILTLSLLDVSLNTLTIGGLAIAVGEVVDDAIIDAENILRRLRENRTASQPRSAVAVVLSASLEVRSAVVYATLIVILVFVPVFFLSGIQGRLFAPLGYAYVLAVLASLVVALTVTPTLSLILLGNGSSAGTPRPLLYLQRGYGLFLRRMDANFALVMTSVALLLAWSIWALLGFGGEFLPELRENHAVVQMRGLPGTSLKESMRAGEIVTRVLKEDPSVTDVAQQGGRAELGEDTHGVEFSEVEVGLAPRPGENAGQIQSRLVERLAKFPGYSFEVMPFLTERMAETISGSTAPVVVKVYGDDFVKLDQAAASVAQALEAVPGVDNVLIEPQVGAPQLVIRIRHTEIAARGLRAGDVLDAVHAAFQGASMAQVYDGNRVIDVAVVIPSEDSDPAIVANLWLSALPSKAISVSASGITNGRVQLGEVADVFLSDGRFLIAHEAGTRQIIVTCHVTGRDLESFVVEAERQVSELALPTSTRAVFAGELEAKRAAERELLLFSSVAGVGILLMLWTAFRSVRDVALLVANLPFALVGGVAAVYVTGGVLNVGALIGFVTLFGISLRNGIMMISHWRHLGHEERVPWGPELVASGAKDRLAPVLMTALTTGLGLLPIAVGSGEAGREVEGPMAQVILGGLITSCLLNLIVLPSLYRRYGDRQATLEKT